MTLKEKFKALLEKWKGEEKEKTPLLTTLEAKLLAAEPGFLGVDTVFEEEGQVVYGVAPDGEQMLKQRGFVLQGEEIELENDDEVVEAVTRFEAAASLVPRNGICPVGFHPSPTDPNRCVKDARDPRKPKPGEKPPFRPERFKRKEGPGTMPPSGRKKPMRTAADCGCGGEGRAAEGEGEKDMCKKELVAKILAKKKSLFVADDAEVLESFSEERLKALAEAKEESDPPPAAPEVTREKVLSLFPDIAAVLARDKAAGEARHAALVTALKTAAKDVYTDDELKAMSVDQLEKVVKVAGASAPVKDFSGGLPRAASESEAIPPPPNMGERIKALRAAKGN